MPIRVECGSCHAGFKAPDGSAGKKGKCPKCGAPITVPGGDTPKAKAPPKASPAVTHVPPIPPAPVTYEPEPTLPAVPNPPAVAPQAPPRTVTVAVDHSAKKGFFGAGFKGTLGCLTAIIVVGMMGCIGVAVLFIGGTAATVTAVEGVMEEVNAKRAERQIIVNAVVSKLVVTQASIGEPTNEYSLAKNTLIFSVRNDGEIPIQSIHFHATIATPGRSIAFAEGDVMADFEGGLEPGETKELRLIPNSYGSDLGKSRAPDDAELTIKITDADWPEES